MRKLILLTLVLAGSLLAQGPVITTFSGACHQWALSPGSASCYAYASCSNGGQQMWVYTYVWSTCGGADVNTLESWANQTDLYSIQSQAIRIHLWGGWQRGFHYRYRDCFNGSYPYDDDEYEC